MWELKLYFYPSAGGFKKKKKMIKKKEANERNANVRIRSRQCNCGGTPPAKFITRGSGTEVKQRPTTCSLGCCKRTRIVGKAHRSPIPAIASRNSRGHTRNTHENRLTHHKQCKHTDTKHRSRGHTHRTYIHVQIMAYTKHKSHVHTH